MADLEPERLLDEPAYFVEHYMKDDPFDYQRDFMNNPSNRKAFVSGRRVGKSRTASWLALWYAVTHDNVDILLTAKAQRQASELFNQIKKDIRTSDLDEDGWGIARDTRTEINFSNGSRIKCLPLGRDGSNIRGFGTELLIVDEAAFIQDEIFQEVLLPMLAVGDGTLVLLSTPFGKKGFLYEKFDEATAEDMTSNDPDTNWYAKNVPTAKNPMIDDKFISEQEENLTRTQFKQEILGEFVEDADSFFTREELMNCAYQPDDPNDESYTVNRAKNEPAYLGVDLAGSGDDESAFISVDAAGNIFDCTSKNMSLTKSKEKVSTLDNYNKYDKIMVDATGLGEGPVEDLERKIGPKVNAFKFTNEKKQSLYNTLKTEFQQGNLRFEFTPGKDDTENQLVQQALDLTTDTTPMGKLKIEHPPGGHDDLTDALALAVWARSQKTFAAVDEDVARPFSMGSLR